MVYEIVVQVWTLATEHVTVPPMPGGQAMTPERLAELRVVLAAMADTPIATLEAHPLPTEVDRSQGVSLGGASPLATQPHWTICAGSPVSDRNRC